MKDFTVNREKKTFVFNDGEELPIPKDKVKQVLRSPAAQKSKQESIEKWKDFSNIVPLGDSGHSFVNNASEGLLGNLGDTAANYAVSGVKAFSPGEGQDEMGYIDRLLDHFYAMQEGRKEHLAQQSEKSPNAAMAGNIAGMGLELGALAGLPATAALPIMGAGHSETSFLEPTEKASEVGQEAVVGLLLDKFFGAASKVAGHRQTRRGIQDAIRNTEEGNIAEIRRAATATDAEGARFATESAARDAEIARIPGLQQAENEAFVNSSAQKIDRVSQAIGKTPIAAEAVGVEPFINDVLELSVNAGSTEGNKVSKFLRSVFKGNAEGKITGESFQKGMRAVDEMITKAGGEIGEILTDFRSFVTQELPAKVGNYVAYEKWFPKIQARIVPTIEKDLTAAFKHSGEVQASIEKSMGKGFLQDVNKSIKVDIEAVFKNHSGNFDSALADGTISKEIQAAVEANPLYQSLVDNVNGIQQVKSSAKSKFGKFEVDIPVPKGFHEVKAGILDIPTQVAERVTSVAERYMPDIALDIQTKAGVAEKSLSQLPKGPNLVTQPAPVNPAQTIQPNLSPVPQLPQPQGVLERLAYGLEGISENGIGGMGRAVKDNAAAGMLGKMAGIPVGTIAAGAAATVTGLSALTSPSVAGAVARTGLEQTARMMDAVQQRASQYPSHRGNGILENPMERRSLVREIEDDLNMKIEDKAIIQSKINRGQALIPSKPFEKTNQR